MESAYDLAFGTQVREEDFGLLFYAMRGPRLYFFSSGDLLSPQFFGSGLSLKEWMKSKTGEVVPQKRLQALEKGMLSLVEKGVLHVR